MIHEGQSSNLGTLFYQDVQEAEDSKGALLRKWSEIKHRKDVVIERAGQRKWKELLMDFNAEIKAVFAKCNATQAVFKRRLEREIKSSKAMSLLERRIGTSSETEDDNGDANRGAERIKKNIQIIARVILQIGEIYNEVNAQIAEVTQAMSAERMRISRETLSGHVVQ